MRQNERGGLGKLAGRVLLPGVAPIDSGEQMLLRGRAPSPASPLLRCGARNTGRTRRVSEGAMVMWMGCKEERGRDQHGSAVIDAHLRLRQNLEKTPGQQRLGSSGSALLAVHWVCGECGRGLRGGVEARVRGGLLSARFGSPWTGCSEGAGELESSPLEQSSCEYGMVRWQAGRGRGGVPR